MRYRLGEREIEFVGTGQWIAPSANVIGSVTLHENASVWFNTVLRGDQDAISIGAESNVQDGSVLHTDVGLKLTVGARVTIGHKVMLHGCEIGNESLIGIGSVVMNGVKIGANSIVGAGSLITEGKEFPAGGLILGSPARFVRELSADETQMILRSAGHYVTNAKRYADSLQAENVP